MMELVDISKCGAQVWSYSNQTRLLQQVTGGQKGTLCLAAENAQPLRAVAARTTTQRQGAREQEDKGSASTKKYATVLVVQNQGDSQVVFDITSEAVTADVTDESSSSRALNSLGESSSGGFNVPQDVGGETNRKKINVLRAAVIPPHAIQTYMF